MAEQKKDPNIEKLVEQELEAGKQGAQVEQEIPTDTLPEDMTQINVKGNIVNLDLDQVDFDPKWNIRDVALQDERVQRKVAELITDGYIRTPLKACRMKDAPKGSKPRGACGFLRFAALTWLSIHEPKFFEDRFKGKIPFEIIEDATERDREQLMYDHGLEEELSEWEVYLAQKRLMRTGIYTQKAMIGILCKMYYKLASVDDRRRYNERLKDLQTTGMALIGSTKVRTVADVRLHTFRGRFQYYQRINESVPAVEEHFKKQCNGEKVAKITFKAAEELQKIKSTDEALQYLGAIKEKQDENKQTARTWSKGRMEQVKAVTKSAYLGKQLDAALGDENAATALPELEAELIKIERAKGFAPVRFWDLVNSLCEEADKVAPQAAPKDDAPEAE